MFLLPLGGVVDPRFGILATPGRWGVTGGVAAGMRWGADLGCLGGPRFVRRFDPAQALPWLRDTMHPYRDNCLFVGVPDHVGDAAATLAAWPRWAPVFRAWPLAYVAQDGAEDLPSPADPPPRALFVGGTTDWKLSDACYSVILRAQRAGHHIHIGRVNYWRRYRHFRQMPGSEEWTCDGTRPRFEGKAQTLQAWADYQQRPCPIRLPLLARHPGRQP